MIERRFENKNRLSFHHATAFCVQTTPCSYSIRVNTTTRGKSSSASYTATTRCCRGNKLLSHPHSSGSRSHAGRGKERLPTFTINIRSYVGVYLHLCIKDSESFGNLCGSLPWRKARFIRKARERPSGRASESEGKNTHGTWRVYRW